MQTARTRRIVCRELKEAPHLFNDVIPTAVE